MEESTKCYTTTIGQFIEDYGHGRIKKPYQQRKASWNSENDKQFIQTIIKHRTTITNIIINKKNGYINVWDGNNRTNAILSFYKKPLELFPEFIDANGLYPEILINNLKGKSLDELIMFRSFSEYCRKNGDLFKWYQETVGSDPDKSDEIDTPFYKLQDKLKGFRFERIVIPTTAYENASDETMVDIYENVNKGGKPITYQDVIAAKAFDTLYKSSLINAYNEIKTAIITYYSSSEEEEYLQINKDNCIIDAEMNTFQLLFGLQMHLNTMYPKIFNRPGEKDVKGNSMDLVFELYKYNVSSDFDVYSDKMNIFINNVINISKYINSIIKQLFDSNVNFDEIEGVSKKKKKNAATSEKTIYPSISKNSMIVLMTYIYVNMNELDTIRRNLKIMLLYHIFNKQTKLDNSYKHIAKENDTLQHQNSGNYVQMAVTQIHRTRELNAPTLEQLQDLISRIVEKSNHPTTNSDKKRQVINEFSRIIICAYYNHTIPRNIIEESKQVDHIVPFSSKWEDCIDINRLGNLMLINEKTNKEKGNRKIDNEFINKHKLYYYLYPSKDEYDLVVKNEIINNEEYNKFCKKREAELINTLIRSL